MRLGIISVLAGSVLMLCAARGQNTQTLKVNLVPDGAVQAGATWNVNGGPPMASGSTVTLASGTTYTIGYADVAGCATPPTISQYLILATTLTGSYGLNAAAVTVNIQPASAAETGARWNLDGGAPQPSGATLSHLYYGGHTINFLAGNGSTAPASQTLYLVGGQTTAVTGSFALTGTTSDYQSGSLTVMLDANAVNAGATWSVDGDGPLASGSTVSFLAVGTHVVTFSNVPGLIAPPAQTVAISFGATTGVSGVYAQPGSVNVVITPPEALGAKWSVDGGPYLASGVTLNGLAPGTHTVDFSAAAGFGAPSPAMVTVTSSSTSFVTGTYTMTSGSATVMISSSDANTGATFEIDGGAQQPSGTTVSGLAAGAHTVSFNAGAGYYPALAQSVVVTAGSTAAVTGSDAAYTGAVQVLYSGPPEGFWIVDGTEPLPSQGLDVGGSIVSGLAPGTHTITYLQAGYSPDYVLPVPQTVTVVANQVTQTTGTFGYRPGYLVVTIVPQAALSAGAEWNLDGGSWQTAATVQIAVAANVQHTLNFSSVPGFTTPASQSFTVLPNKFAELTGTYTPPPGAVSVTINPAGAVSAGAEWYVDGGAYQASGATLANVAAGSHTVGFTAVPGYITPASQAITVGSGTTSQVSVTYAQAASVTVNLSPTGAVNAGAEWAVDSGAWQVSGTTVGGLTAGQHTIWYMPVLGYFTPQSQVVNLSAGQALTVNTTYIAPASVTVNLLPAGAVAAGATWSLNGGAAMLSGSAITGITPGNYTVTFGGAAGYDAPASQSVTLGSGQNVTLTGTYVATAGGVMVTISPPDAVTAGATWAVDGGAAQTSGATVGGLAVGAHTISFNSVANYNAPATQQVLVVDQQTASVTGTYSAQPGAVMVTIVPNDAAFYGYAEYSIDGGPGERTTNHHETGQFQLPVEGDFGTFYNTDAGLAPGQHTISFLAAAGYITPAPQTFTVVSNGTTSVTGSYGGIPVVGVYQLEPSGLDPQLVSGSSVLNLGTLVTGSSATEELAVLSIGTANLSDISVSFSGPDAAMFQATVGSTLPPPPYYSMSGTTGLMQTGTTFTVTCVPDRPGPHEATMNISSNDPVTPVFQVLLEVTGSGGGAIDLVNAAGQYAGLMSSTGPHLYDIARFTVTKSGQVTGSVTANGKAATVKGKFDVTGAFTGTPKTISLTLSSGTDGPLNPLAYAIAGTTGTGASAEWYEAWHAAYGAKDVPVEAARYNVLLTGSDTSLSVPQGSGYVILKVAKGGTVTVSGKLADGGAVTAAGGIFSTPLGHQFYLYDTSLYTNRGFVGGAVTFDGTGSTLSADGLGWQRPKTSGIYPAGFNTTLEATGAPYVKPLKGIAPLAVTTGTVSLSYGGLVDAILEPVTLSGSGGLVFTGSNASQIKLTIDTANGSFTGSFKHPASKQRVSFTGLLDQDPGDPWAGGFFIGPKVSGTSLGGGVMLTP